MESPEQTLERIGVRDVTPQMIGKKAPCDEPKRQPRFCLTRFREITLETSSLYVIKDILPATGLVVVWGPPKCGKSFWAFDALMHVALGWSYRGRRVRQGVVVYCALEGALGFKKRKEAFRLHHLADTSDADPPFYLMDQPLALVVDRAAFVAAIKKQLGKTTPAVVCIDTLNRSLTGSESSDEDMSAYIKAADAVRDAFGCLVVIVHHCGHDQQRPRGHSSLIGALDVQIAVRRDASAQIVAELELSKDGPVGLILASRLEPVQVGIDEDGDAITSCVVKPDERADTPRGVDARNRDQWSKSLLIFKAALVAALAESGVKARPFPDGPEVVTATRDQVRAEFRRRYPADERKTKGEAFRRSERDAIGGGLIGSRELDGEDARTLMWLTTT